MLFFDKKPSVVLLKNAVKALRHGELFFQN